MPYIALGPRMLNASPDGTGLNAGNLTTAFTPDVLASNVPYYEVYHMIVSNVPIGNSAKIVVNGKPWGFTLPNGGSEWDPAQPLLMNPGDELDFLWTIASSVTTLPNVTVWLRYDPSIPANSRIAPGV